jgi:hypothetical protein
MDTWTDLVESDPLGCAGRRVLYCEVCGRDFGTESALVAADAWGTGAYDFEPRPGRCFRHPAKRQAKGRR